MSAALHRRLQRIKQRLSVRSWEYRQRHLSKGVWHRLRRVLVEAEEAYVVTPEEAQRIMASGVEAEAVGKELQPEKLFLFVSREQLAGVSHAQRIPVRLSSELLSAGAVLLVPFESG